MNHEEPLCKVFNINTSARIDLLPAAQEEPLTKSYAGEFDKLVGELGAFRDARDAGEQRDRAQRQDAQAASIARQQAEAQRNRRMHHVQRQQHQHQHRRLAKATTPPPPAPDWGGLAAQQAAIEESMQQTAARATQNAVRDHIAEMRQAARAGQLDAMTACKLDALIGRAAALGLQP